MNIERQYIYFIGVGGIGMSALARYFNQLGKSIAGYDRTITDLTKHLQSEGIHISYFADADAIPFPYRDKEDTLVVYTPAIPDDNPILVYFREEGFDCMKRAEVLGLLSRHLETIAVAGTHGKTTVSSMITYLLHSAGLKINAFLGGISRDFGTNMLLNPEAKLMITEADEYDRSFLHLHPNKLVVTSIDSDHLDIYENEDDLKRTYEKLLQQINEKGELFSKPEVVQSLNIPNELTVNSYSITDEADIIASNIRVENGAFTFDYISNNVKLEGVRCGLPGIHNVENALVAISLAIGQGVSPEDAKNYIGRFQGVKRRFDVHLKTNDIVYIDDYAHHPEEISSLFSSVRKLFPDKKMTAIFQPHLYSRTRDFVEEFAAILATADEVILLEIYPAREEPIEGVDSLWLAKKMKKEGVNVCQKHQLINILKSKEVEVLLTIGAGDIDTMIHPIIEHYEVLA